MDQTVKFPVWFDPKSLGGTPMRAALSKTMETVAGWCEDPRDSYPPTILHVTDGQSTDDTVGVVPVLPPDPTTGAGHDQ